MNRDEFASAVAARFQAVRVDLEPRVREAIRHQPLMDADYAVALNVAQNVLKEALAAALQPAMPQPQPFFGELATRLACYALTCLHPDEQERIALQVQAGLLPKLADMQAAGNVLKGEWQ